MESVRADVAWLENHYGGLRQACDATGLKYRTLQGIRLVGKNARVRDTLAARIKALCENPPPYQEVQLCANCRENPKTIGHYCSAECKVEADDRAWHTRYIEVKKVRPIALYLRDLYGTIEALSEATGISASTIDEVLYSKRKRGIRRATARQILEAFNDQRKRGRNIFSETHENEEPPRYAVSSDQEALERSNRAQNWKATG